MLVQNSPPIHSAVLINLVAVRTGGGLQNSLSFLSDLHNHNTLDLPYIIACTHGEPIHDLCILYGLPHYSVEPNFFGRLKHELFGHLKLPRSYRIQIVFTLFGNSPLWAIHPIKISGFAYSNLLHKNVPFWSFLPLHKRLFKVAKDRLRLAMALFSDHIIFETEYLRLLALSSILKTKQLHVVEMEASKLIASVDKPRLTAWEQPWNFLALSGPHPNKRIHLFAPILQLINFHRTLLGYQPARLQVTFGDNTEYSTKIIQAFDNCNVLDFLDFVGPISPYDISHALESVQAIVNISLLESFSNNWVEAWMSQTILILTDAPWSRSSCGDSPIYINPLDPTSSAFNICSVLCNHTKMSQKLAHGLQLLDNYNQGSKTQKYTSIINSVLH